VPDENPEGISEEFLSAFRARVVRALAELVEIYLPQAKNRDLVEKTSPKDALAIVKSALELMNDLCSSPELGRQREKSFTYRPLCPQSPTTLAPSQRESTPSGPPTSKPATVDDLHRLIDNAVYEIAQMEEETKELEGWARLLVRCDSLMKKLEKSICPDPPTNAKTRPSNSAHKISAGETATKNPEAPVGNSQPSASASEPQGNDANARAP